MSSLAEFGNTGAKFTDVSERVTKRREFEMKNRGFYLKNDRTIQQADSEVAIKVKVVVSESLTGSRVKNQSKSEQKMSPKR